MELIFRWYEEASKEMINSVDIHNGEHPDCYIIATNGKLELYATREGSGGYDELVSDEAMQFTGLTDNTGKDYYIGDIGEFENGDKFCLKMENEMLEVYVDWIGEPECEDQARDLDSIGRAKIIGNIHQHPELIGGNNNDT